MGIVSIRSILSIGLLRRALRSIPDSFPEGTDPTRAPTGGQRPWLPVSPSPADGRLTGGDPAVHNAAWGRLETVTSTRCRPAVHGSSGTRLGSGQGEQRMTSPRTPADAATLARWYRQMVEIRLFEEKVQELFRRARSRGRPTCARARRPSRSARSRPWSPATSRRTRTAATARRSPSGWRHEVAFAELMGRSDRLLQGPRRLDAPDRRLEGQHRGQRDRRRRPADRRGGGDGVQAPRASRTSR